MKKLHNKMSLLVSLLHGNKGRLAVLILTIVLFVLSAAAPNATIGIGQ